MGMVRGEGIGGGGIERGCVGCVGGGGADGCIS